MFCRRDLPVNAERGRGKIWLGGVGMDLIFRESRPEAATKEVYTYGDYLSWPAEERWELIEGCPYQLI